MRPALLPTKTHPPPIPGGQVARPRLDLCLQTALDNHHRLILVSAPPGSGKTSLVAAWAARQRVPHAWVSLEPADNDPLRFWLYVLLAIQPQYPEAAQALIEDLSTATSVPPLLVTELVGLLCSKPRPLIIILDDYHCIENSAIHAGIQDLLEHLPAPITLAIVTRIDPALPLHRWRGRGQLTELRAADLRFTLPEANEFLNLRMGLELQPAQVQALEERTEGWATGLQLAALSMRGRKDTQTFIEAFSGSHHFILEYLMNEVFNRQTEAVQRFLMCTSILDQLSAGLCDAVVEHQAGSEAMLDFLASSNLFLFPLDDEHIWFRYHALFADFLRQRLKRQGPDALPGLHQRAAEWYAGHSQVEQALRHALAAKNYAFATDLVRRHAYPAASEGRPHELIGWLEALPHEYLVKDFQLILIYAWMLNAVGRTSALEPLFREADLVLASADTGAMSAADRQAALGQLAALRAMQAARMRDPAETDRWVAEARRYASPENPSVQGLAWFAEAYLQSDLGNFEQAIPAYLQALPLMDFAQQIYGVSNQVRALGEAYLAQGQLQAAGDLYRSYLARVSPARPRSAPALGILQCALAGVEYEQGHLAEAQTRFEQSEASSRRSSMVDLLASTAVLGARLQRAEHDLPGAILRLREAQIQMRSAEARTHAAEVNAWLARFQAEAGYLAEAQAWAREIQPCPEHNPGYAHGVELFCLARLLIAQDRLGEALSLVQKLEYHANQGRSLARVIEAQMLQAEVLWRQGDSKQSMDRLASGLELAEPAGLVRLFLDEGDRLAAVLKACLTGTRLTAAQRVFAGRLLERIPFESGPAGGSQSPGPPGGESDLTKRELDVLRGLMEGLSYPEIAARLVISSGTVKTHVSHIYGKLGVKGRMEAIRRARELKIE
jgi:LuxR family maltose regulon positive regulatory protein